jgi:uncharacterized protein YcfL
MKKLVIASFISCLCIVACKSGGSGESTNNSQVVTEDEAIEDPNADTDSISTKSNTGGNAGTESTTVQGGSSSGTNGTGTTDNGGANSAGESK